MEKTKELLELDLSNEKASNDLAVWLAKEVVRQLNSDRKTISILNRSRGKDYARAFDEFVKRLENFLLNSVFPSVPLTAFRVKGSANYQIIEIEVHRSFFFFIHTRSTLTSPTSRSTTIV